MSTLASSRITGLSLVPRLQLPAIPPDELRVSLADKVDNARAIAADYRLLGEALWSRFSVGSRDQLWYYRSLVEVIGTARPPGRLLGLLDAQVTEIEALLASAR